MTLVRPIAAGAAAGQRSLPLSSPSRRFSFQSSRAEAMKIQVVKSPGGMTAWLVEEHSRAADRACASPSRAAAPRTPRARRASRISWPACWTKARATSTPRQFQERMEEIAMRMSFDDARDAFYGSLETLSENRDKAVALLALALGKPRFDADAVDRVRGQLLAGLAYAARDPDRVASEQWSAMAFAGHPYGRPANGTQASIQKMTRDDLRRLLVAHVRQGQPARGRGGRHRCRHARRRARHRVRPAAGQGQAHAGARRPSRPPSRSSR